MNRNDADLAPPPRAATASSDAEHRAWSYYFADGLPNLLAGIGCLLVSGTFLLILRYHHQRSPFLIAGAAVFFSISGVVLIRFRETVDWLKSRITYPRTGYAAPPYFTEYSTPPADLVMLNLSGVREKETRTPFLVAEDLRWRLWVILGTLAVEPLAGRFIVSHILCLLAGCAAGFLVLWASRNDPRRSWAIVFGLVLLQMNSLVLLNSLQIYGAVYFQAGVGLALTLAGAITLARYLNRNPAMRT